MAFQVGPFQPAYQQVTSVVARVIPGGVKRKRRILPDGRHIFATEQEAFNALSKYYEQHKLKPSEAAVIGKPPNRKKVIVLPSERQEILAAVEMLEDVDHEQMRRMVRRQEEEWLIFTIH